MNPNFGTVTRYLLSTFMRGIMTKSLKDQNKPSLAIFVLLQAVICAWVLSGTPFNFDSLHEQLTELMAATAATSVVGIFIILISGFFGDHIKAMLVFWRPKYPLAGCRAFTSLMHNDHRIDPVKIASKYGPLPNEPKSQNSLWYSIYRQQINDPGVRQTHGNYLLSRELAWIAFVFIFVGGGASFYWVGNTETTWVYLGSLSATYLVTATAARHYGIRLVTNVLAADCATG